jgi:hypothetical protein
LFSFTTAGFSRCRFKISVGGKERGKAYLFFLHLSSDQRTKLFPLPRRGGAG